MKKYIVVTPLKLTPKKTLQVDEVVEMDAAQAAELIDINAIKEINGKAAPAKPLIPEATPVELLTKEIKAMNKGPLDAFVAKHEIAIDGYAEMNVTNKKAAVVALVNDDLVAKVEASKEVDETGTGEGQE